MLQEKGGEGYMLFLNYEERIEFAGMNCIIDHIIYLYKCIYSHSHRLGINYYLTVYHPIDLVLH
jgi:hypothetical protein